MNKNVKKALLFLLSLCLTAGLFTGMAGAGFAESAPLFDAAAGTGLQILLPAQPGESEKDAAAKLQAYLEEITGVKPEIVTALPEEPAGGVISLSIEERLSSQPKGSYCLRRGYDETKKAADDPVFYIEGADARGLYNGVFGFLRRECGVEIYSTNVKTVPKADRIAPETPYWFTYTPTLEYADTDWVSPHDLEFSLANGLNGVYSPLENLHGGKVNYLWFCHSITNGIVPEDQFFESHPEYYALQDDGTRKASQLCLSNPEVIAQAKKDVRKRVEEAYNPNAAVNIISVTQDDNYDYCHCENCTAIAEQYGGQSGLMIWFVNQIADDIGPDYPDLVVDTFAYQYTRQAPKGIIPRDNVCVRLCSIECCFAHALNDPNCDANVKFMQDLEDWSKICNRMYVWDYVTDFSHTLSIFPNFQVLRSNINTFRTHNVVGIYEEGAYYADPAAIEFYDLRAYLLSVLMRDEMTAEEELAARDGFLKAYYGGEQGGAAVGEILDIFEKNAGDDNGHMSIGSEPRHTLFGITDEEIRRVNELWQIALSAAKETGDDAAVTRIENSRLSWRYWEACNCKGEFKSLLPGIRNVGTMKKLISDLQTTGVTRYNEGLSLSDLKLNPFVSPSDWPQKDAPIVVPSVILAGIVILLCLAAAVIVFRKKHPLCALLILVLAAAAVPLGISSGELFILWDNLALYGFIDALMLLDVASFCMIAVWAKNGASFPKGKKAVLAVIGSLFVAAAPYEVVVLIINTLIYHGFRPLFSITLSSYVQMAVVAACAIVIMRSFTRKNKTETKTEEE